MKKQEEQREEPIIPSAVTGFRLFQISKEKTDNDEIGFVLKSLYQSSAWKRGENTAFCLPNIYYHLNSENDKTTCYFSGEPVPEKECHCGLQAYYNLELDLIIEPSFLDRYAIASVAGAGKVLMHNHGFRSEKAQITGLFFPDYKEVIDQEIFQEVYSKNLEVAKYYKINIFQSKEGFLDNAKKYGQIINPKKDPHLIPRKGDYIRFYYGPNNLDDEIEIHGGDCSLKIMNSITDHDYKFDDYPTSLLAKRSIFKSFSWGIGSRYRRLKDIDSVFYEKSSQLIKSSATKTTIKIAKLLDSPKQYILLGMMIILLSMFLNFNKISFIPESIDSLVVVVIFISMMVSLRFSRKRIRKKLIKSVKNKISS